MHGATRDVFHANTLQGYLKISGGVTRGQACKSDVIEQYYSLAWIKDTLKSDIWIVQPAPKKMFYYEIGRLLVSLFRLPNIFMNGMFACPALVHGSSNTEAVSDVA